MPRPLALLALVLVLGGCGDARLRVNGTQTEATLEDTFNASAAAVGDAVERVCPRSVRIGFVRGRISGTNYEKSLVGLMQGHFSEERRTMVYEAMTSALAVELSQRGYQTIAEDAQAIRKVQAEGNAFGKQGVELAQEDVAGCVIRVDLAAKAFCVGSGSVEVLEGPSFRFSITDVKTTAVLARVNVD
ncbi:MAG: hypothetical protein J0M02_08420 [Planctomycetes bacterium]|nr:hypothetical protein [Planctomycetota bacterium]